MAMFPTRLQDAQPEIVLPLATSAAQGGQLRPGMFVTSAELFPRVRIHDADDMHPRAVPAIIAVMDPRSRVVPPASTEPFVAAASSRVKRVLRYHGDVGVALQHLGPLIGANAHRSLWPAILESLEACAGR